MAKLIQARDLRGARRESLLDAVPLPAPWTMFVEPINACNLRCKFCPTGHPALLKQMGRENTIMSLDLWRQVIDDIATFPRPLRMLNTYKDGESLLHPRFPDMIRYAKAAGVSEQIWLKTNGLNLSPALSRELVSCGLDMIGISVQHVTSEGYKAIAGKAIDYERYRLHVQDLYIKAKERGVKVSIKIADTGLTADERQKFLDDFTDRCDYITVEGLHGWSTSELYDWKLGTDNSFDGTPRTPKVACPLVLYMLTVSANGDVSICNDDAFHLHRLGNVNSGSLLDIWNGDKLKRFRLMHLQGRRGDNAACANCDYMQALPDNIDADRETFAERLNK
jgi:radical SAM protein with 4Fe4S-binding SPASM domain